MSFLPSYFVKPFIGASLGLIVYFLIRGGFFSFTAEGEGKLNPYGIAGISALVGIFTSNIMVRLREIMKQAFGSSKEKEPDKDRMSVAGPKE